MRGMQAIVGDFKSGGSPIDYFREGIINSDAQKVSQELCQQGTDLGSVETLTREKKLALISVGSSVNSDYIKDLVKKCQERGFVPVVLCGKSEALKSELEAQNEGQENKRVIPLSRVNDHVIGWLDRKASVICVSGGGMTLLELLKIKELEPDAMADTQIVYYAKGDLVVRPPHEDRSLAYFKQILPGRVYRSDEWGGGVHQERLPDDHGLSRTARWCALWSHRRTGDTAAPLLLTVRRRTMGGG